MGDPETLLTVFSAEIEERGGDPVVGLPDREVDLGDLTVGETYRVAVFSRSETGTTDGAPTRERRRTQETSEPPVERGELREFEIEDTGDKGDGIARVGPGYVVFVPDTEVGDRVTVEITQVRENFAFAEVVEAEPVSG